MRTAAGPPAPAGHRPAHAGGSVLRALPLLAALALLGRPELAGALTASTCGGPVECRCGDRVSRDYTLPRDLGPCPGHGLLPLSGVSLDCAGFRILGRGDGSEQYGIYLEGVTGVSVERCVVSGFLRGIRLRDARGNLIRGNTVERNGSAAKRTGYGIDIASGASGNRIEDNTVRENGDEGIHMGAGSGGNRVTGNVILGNAREQLYVLASHGNVFLGNRVGGGGASSLYLKDAHHNRFEGNTFTDRPVRITGSASENTFVENRLVDATLHFRAHPGPPPRAPGDNRVSGGVIRHRETCVRFTASRANVVDGVRLEGCRTPVASEGAAGGPSENTLVSVPLDRERVEADAASTLSVGWRVTLRVQDARGAPVAGSRVRIVDARGTLVADVVTDAGGTLPPLVLLEYVRTGPTTAARTPHVITTTRQGYQPDVRTLEVRRDLDATVSLEADGTGNRPELPRSQVGGSSVRLP